MSRRVARIVLEAPVVSFRYPHFLIGRQPTFDMPPPSTVFGHVASALGEWPTAPFEFAYHFRSVSRGSDLEHQHIISPYTGRGSVFTEKDPHWAPPPDAPTKGKKTKKPPEAPPIGTSVQSTVQPHLRDFLFGITWTLYLDPPELADAFRSPVFPVVLGRSQDLACIARVDTVELTTVPAVYFERTILPISFRQRLAWGTTALMPSFISQPPQRNAEFAPYIVLHDRVYAGDVSLKTNRKILSGPGLDPLTLWCDPDSPVDHTMHRGVWFHRAHPDGGSHV